MLAGLNMSVCFGCCRVTAQKERLSRLLDLIIAGFLLYLGYISTSYECVLVTVGLQRRRC